MTSALMRSSVPVPRQLAAKRSLAELAQPRRRLGKVPQLKSERHVLCVARTWVGLDGPDRARGALPARHAADLTPGR